MRELQTPAAWNDEFDLIVIGSGAGGLSAAVTGALRGLSVLVLEKTDRIGGSTAVSGGVVWIPASDQAAACGHPDSVDNAMTYLAHVVGGASPAALQRCYVESAPAMLRDLQAQGAVQLAARAHAPDYYPDAPGASLGGRAMDPAPFDGRLLGANFQDLRDPLQPFMVLGGMMVNTADARHLLAVTRSFVSWKHGMALVVRYFADRLRGYHRGTRLVLGNALAARLYAKALALGIPCRRSAQVLGIVTGQGRVQGVEVAHAGGRQRLKARRGVVVATGGFPWDEAMRQRHFPAPTGPWSMSLQDNRGDGLRLAQEAGAALGQGHVGAGLWAPVSIWQRADGSVVRYPHLVWDRAKPGLMAVNAAGRRFVNESTTYHEFVLAMRRSHESVPTIPAWLVCDADFIAKWGLGLALPGGRPREHLVRDGYLHQADSLEALARSIGVDAAGLQASALQFNEAARLGVDAAFGKGSNEYNRHLGDLSHGPNPCLGPLARGPFFAIAVQPGDIGTALGIRCNEHAQALDAQGRAIPGLYAAGNDLHSVMGGTYPSAGITLGPALTFGWLAGCHAAATATADDAARAESQADELPA